MDSNKDKKSSGKVAKVKNILLNAYEKFLKDKINSNKNSTKSAKSTDENKTDSKPVEKEIKKGTNKHSNQNSDDFNKRLELKLGELKSLYLKTYNNLEQFDNLLENIKQICSERPEELKTLDKKREKNPNWYLSNKIIGENIYIDKFANDIKTTIEKLPYFNNLGINFLNVGLDSTKDNSLINFSSIAKRTIGDLKKLASSCYENKITLALNLSINSTKKTYTWAKKAVDGDKSCQDMYYCLYFKDAKELDPNLTCRASSNKFVYSKKIDKYFLSSSNKMQLDLNYSNPAVFNEMIFNILNLANKGIGAFSLNSLDGLFFEKENQTHKILRMFRIILEIVCPGVLLISSASKDLENSKIYFGTKLKPECHLVYNSNLSANLFNAIATNDVRLLKKQMSSFNKLKPHQNYINCVSNGEGINLKFDKADLDNLNINSDELTKFFQDFYSGKDENSFAIGKVLETKIFGTTASLCGIEKYKENNPAALNLSIKRVLLLYSFIMTLPGMPVVNCADEIAALNNYTSDDLNCLPKAEFNWEDAKNINNIKTMQGQIFKGIKKLYTMRKTNKCMNYDSNIKLKATNDNSVICFLRQTGDIITLCLYNFSFDKKCIKLYNSFAENLQNHKKEDLNSVELNSYESKFFKLIDKKEL